MSTRHDLFSYWCKLFKAQWVTYGSLDVSCVDGWGMAIWWGAASIHPHLEGRYSGKEDSDLLLILAQQLKSCRHNSVTVISILSVCLQIVDRPCCTWITVGQYAHEYCHASQVVLHIFRGLGCLTIEDFGIMIFKTLGFTHPVTVSYPRTPGCSAALLW